MKGTALFSRIAGTGTLSGMSPAVGGFFRKYLSHEKIVEFDGKHVVNTHFPPWPSHAFDRMAARFSDIGSSENRTLYSVTLALTNRCGYLCRHCYNAGRKQQDIPAALWREAARTLEDMGVARVTLSGGEPLLRNDLEDIAGSFSDAVSINLNTTGSGLTAERSRALKESGVFAAGVSIDSFDSTVHDRQRGRRGALDAALSALETAKNAGLYPYIMTVASHELLEGSAFMQFMENARRAGALEVHLLEPCPVGRLAGETAALLTGGERGRILGYQEEIAGREDLPILSSFLHLESADAFGCGAGLTHLYIDGAGEVGPCNLVPLSFGNILETALEDILARMGRYFTEPRTECVGHTLAPFIPHDAAPAPPDISEDICRRHLPAEHDIPAFFRARKETIGATGAREIETAYDHVAGSYDDFWVVEAGKPVKALVESLDIRKDMRVLEAGCGTGFATALLCERLGDGADCLAVDISSNMLGQAEKRLAKTRGASPSLIRGNALDVLRSEGPFDLVFSSWVLGYIPTKEFIGSAAKHLKPGGRLAFIVHRKHSPVREMGIFEEIVAEDPAVLMRRVDFDFPEDGEHVRSMIAEAGLTVESIEEDAVVFPYDTAEQALRHLLESGAGTAFHEALEPGRREELTSRFVEMLAERNSGAPAFDVTHDYVAAVAVRGSG